uniref:Uncharacterized protein n=1 Tax=viral metagenome TaxID=1070528 RepID=A0A6M3IJQ7_9ZZZZ
MTEHTDYSIGSIAAALKASPVAVLGLIKQGRIPATKIGDVIYVAAEDMRTRVAEEITLPAPDISRPVPPQTSTPQAEIASLRAELARVQEMLRHVQAANVQIAAKTAAPESKQSCQTPEPPAADTKRIRRRAKDDSNGNAASE